MKKIILTTVSIFAFGFANAQEGNFKVGAHLGLPIGDLKDSHSLNIGADVAYVWGISDKFEAGIASGYSTYLGKTIDIPGGSYKVESIGFIPVAATAKYNIATDWFLGADLGYAIATSKDGKGGLLYQPKFGYNGDTFEVYAGYKGISVENGSVNSVNLGVNFKL
ncbi:hypothetical protein [Flavobacterium sp.]|uniref:hypothetical protein n=1 Tax=Flavobacterium sp. TaxID=239 RepID=UPI003C48852C